MQCFVKAVVVGLVCGVIARADKPPNFLILFVDDMGYGDLG